MRQIIKGLARKVPLLGRVVQERDELRETLCALFMPPGHFYSPIPSLEEVRADEERIFRMPRGLPTVDLNEGEQLELLNAFKEYYKELPPWGDDKSEGLRYHFDNPNFPHADAISLYAMLRHLRPKRIVEIGSGYSSCVTLDTNELFLDNRVACTFIEPHPELLLSLIKDGDKRRVEIISSKLQDVDPKHFSSLSENDILFIDSTHVSKVGSDVNHIFFEIIPSLNSGVYIHFHDICYPFEYPKMWVYENRAWNESYLLRAFLQYNQAFKIVFFNNFLGHFFPEEIAKDMPLFMKNIGGSIWLRKV